MQSGKLVNASRGESRVMSLLVETQCLPFITGVISGCHTGLTPGKERGEGLCFVQEGWHPQAVGVWAGCRGWQLTGGTEDEGVSLRRMGRV